MNKSKLKVLFALHLMLMVYSMSGICSKMASQQPFLSFKFCLFYAIIIFLLGFYAIGWQQIIKRLPLTTAFANKAVTVVWGIVWGAVFFHESITVGKVIGAALVIVGVVIYARAVLIYSCVLLVGVFVSAISQVLLKKAAMKHYENHLKEYLNPMVIFAYAMFVGTTFLSIIAYRGIPLSMGPILEATSYIYVTVFGVKIFHERLNKKKIIALFFIVGGIIIYSVCG